MELNESLATIEEFLNGKRQVPLTSDDLKLIKGAYDVVREDVDLMVADKEPNMSDEKNGVVLSSLHLLMNRTLSIPLTEDIKDLLKPFSDLIYNWNNNTAKNEEINTLSSFLYRSVQSHFTMIEAIDMMKVLSKHLSDIKAWSPPAFEISRHYYEVLQKQLRGEVGSDLCKISDQKKSC